jgi:hypothetical protein
MRPPDDDPGVKAFFRRDDPSPADPHDAAVMRAAADVLRALDPDRPPTASLELAALMAEGTTRSNPMKTSTRAALTRFAGLGVAAKALLATGVAIAGVGGAATAVALSTGHLDAHHGGHHGVVHSRSTESPSPNPAGSADDHGGVAHNPGADDATPEPAESAEPGEHHGDRHGDNDGEEHGSNRSPGGPPSAAGKDDGKGGDNGKGDDNGGGKGDGKSGGGDSSGSGSSGSSGHGSDGGSGKDGGGSGKDGGHGGGESDG